jgi:hypothetical protein
VISRRTLLALAAASTAMPMSARAQSSDAPKKLAGICFAYTPISHAHVIFAKYLDGYESFRKGLNPLSRKRGDAQDGVDAPFSQQQLPPPYQPTRPRSEIASLYVAQRPENDLSRQVSDKYGIPMHRSIYEALALGGDKLAVDGVLLIGEHGDYPGNEKGQKLYPRFEAFLEITDVFRQTGRAVPVFSDKHLSYDWRKAHRMVEISKELDFPLMAGSSLPVTWRIPAVDVPYGATVKHAVGVAFGGLDSYGLHLLESIQCMVERRKGGETGVKSVQCLEDGAVWNFLNRTPWAKRLFDRAVPHAVETYDAGRPRSVVEHPAVLLVEHNDGLQTAGFLLTNYLRDFTVAVDVEGRAEPISTLMHLEQTAFSGYHFVCQLKNIERMFETGKATYPAERTMLTSGILDLALESRVRGHKRLPTPMLAMRYQSPDESFYCTEGPRYLHNPGKLPIERVEPPG